MGAEGIAAGEASQANQVLALPAAKPSKVYLNKAQIIEEPQVLNGLAEKMMTRYFGQPSFTRRDGLSNIHQYYVSANCAMDVFTFNESLENDSALTNQAFVIEHVEVRASGAETEQSCVSEALNHEAMAFDSFIARR